jgi:hypothetical protein
MFRLERLQSPEWRLVLPVRPESIRVRQLDLSIQPAPHVRREPAFESMAVGKFVVCDDCGALFVIEGAPAKLVETPILIGALGEVCAAESNLRSGNLSIDQKIRLAALRKRSERI